MTLKKSVMTVLWRVQQAQMVISIVFWSLTLTGVFYPYIRARFLNDLIGPEYVFLGMLLIFIVVIGGIILFGLLYDRLKFWREQTLVAQERNPFAYGGMILPVHLILWNAVLHPDDEAAQELARQMIYRNLSDPRVRKAYDKIQEELV